ncbi:MAG: NeuD/PglB/VioB family sugar acetyltransferase [Caldilineaceae bacterium]
MRRMTAKRLFDLVVTVLFLVLAWPLVLLVALGVRVKLGAPVLFRQQRPGYRGQPFVLLKFRSMTDARDADGALLPDVERLPAFGRFLRSTSLDELPELINVLRGEMSLVGPRPLLWHYLDLYTPEQMRRHDVLPGITGWAQVSGRNAISWAERFALDLWYVDNHSLWVDLKIIGLTLLRIVQRDGINQPGHVTIQPFKGQAFLHQNRADPEAMTPRSTPATSTVPVRSTSPATAAAPQRRVLIIGAGGHGQVVANILLQARAQGSVWEPIGYLDDNQAIVGQRRLGLPILGAINQLAEITHDGIIIAVGENYRRAELFNRFSAAAEEMITVCHPTAVIAPNVPLGPGTVVGAGVVINPGSRIGANVILNTHCTIEHHNVIGDHAHIAPGACLGGDVEVGDGAMVGIGASVLPQCWIGAWSTVGGGALVHRTVAEHVTVVGVPAQPLLPTHSEPRPQRRPGALHRQPQLDEASAVVAPNHALEQPST